MTRTDYNWLGALFSFLRLLALTLATAYLTLDQVAKESLTPKAAGIAFATAFALTTVNFLRPGETRFGTPPNNDAGYGQLEVLGAVIAVAGLLVAVTTSVVLGIVLLFLGVVLAVA